MPNVKGFDTKDIGLLVDALTLIPNLPIVAFAAKRAKQRLKYPIESRAQLVELLDDRTVGEFDGRRISVQDIERFVPDEFFPMEDQHALLCRLLIAFQRGDLFHQQEMIASAAENPIPISRETTIIPMPSTIYGSVRRT